MSVEHTHELDCSGLNCPMPVIKTKKALTPLQSGDVLKVLSTDPGSVPDMSALSRRTGNEIIEQTESNGEYVFYFKKG